MKKTSFFLLLMASSAFADRNAMEDIQNLNTEVFKARYNRYYHGHGNTAIIQDKNRQAANLMSGVTSSISKDRYASADERIEVLKGLYQMMLENQTPTIFREGPHQSHHFVLHMMAFGVKSFYENYTLLMNENKFFSHIKNHQADITKGFKGDFSEYFQMNRLAQIFPNGYLHHLLAMGANKEEDLIRIHYASHKSGYPVEVSDTSFFYIPQMQHGGHFQYTLEEGRFKVKRFGVTYSSFDIFPMEEIEYRLDVSKGIPSKSPTTAKKETPEKDESFQKKIDQPEQYYHRNFHRRLDYLDEMTSAKDNNDTTTLYLNFFKMTKLLDEGINNFSSVDLKNLKSQAKSDAFYKKWAANLNPENVQNDMKENPSDPQENTYVIHLIKEYRQDIFKMFLYCLMNLDDFEVAPKTKSVHAKDKEILEDLPFEEDDFAISLNDRFRTFDWGIETMEKVIDFLNKSNSTLTAITGMAGGSKVQKKNAQNQKDLLKTDTEEFKKTILESIRKHDDYDYASNPIDYAIMMEKAANYKQEKIEFVTKLGGITTVVRKHPDLQGILEECFYKDVLKDITDAITALTKKDPHSSVTGDTPILKIMGGVKGSNTK